MQTRQTSGHIKTHHLVPHADHPPLSVSAVCVRIIGHDDKWLRLRWRVEGAEKLILPSFAGKGRADGLWQTTCFELFLRAADKARYSEFNFSPSERWAAYDFSDYREGMVDRPVPHEPICSIQKGTSIVVFDVAVPVDAFPADVLSGAECAAGFCAVIEEQGGARSYWALAHPEGAPDFHASACFAATLTLRR